MANQKISELTAISTIDNATDVLPIVDTSETTTKKITLTQVKTSLALNNVDNTSDANKPISSATQTALDAKQSTLVSATNIKTVNSTSLLGSGDVAVQATLVSGTNIKTINSTSLLGSGDIAISASPSGVSGAIQFSNGSAFASDATNFFWDNTNKRLGVGLNTPATTLDILPPVQTATATQFDCFRVGYSNSTIGVTNGSALQVQVATTGSSRYSTTLRLSGGSDTSQAYLKAFDSNLFGVMLNRAQSNLGLFSDNGIKLGATAFAGSEGAASGMVHIKGSGSTSATTSLLVQNSAGTQTLKIQDDGTSTIGASGSGVFTVNSLYGFINMSGGYLGYGFSATEAWTYRTGSNVSQFKIGTTGNAIFNGTLSLGNGSDPVASAQVEITSTTKGFLPPRMTTTQKNAIASPAAGLVLYDSTTNKLQCYNGSTWNDLF